MNKATTITLGLLVLVAGVYFFLRADSPAVEPSFELEAISDLERIEIMGPSDAQTPELVVVQRRGDGNWWLMRPEEVLLDPDVAEWFGTVFTRSIGTDDVVIDARHADLYDLDEEQAVRIALFAVGRDRPTHELLVGRETTVEQTGARRTLFKLPGGDVIYRGQAGFGHLVRLTPDEMRHRTVVDISSSAIDRIAIRDEHDHQWQRDGEEWIKQSSQREESGGEVNGVEENTEETIPDDSTEGIQSDQIQSLVDAIGGLRARRWASAISPERAGLGEEATIIEIGAGDTATTLFVGSPVDDGAQRRYARYSETEGVFELSSEFVRALASVMPEWSE